jgi:hypothetical protein
MKVKLSWKARSMEVGVVRAFTLALLFNGSISAIHGNPNTVTDLKDFDDDSMRLLVEEGRNQMERQASRFRHATDRAQNLLTVDLAVLGFLAALLHQLLRVHKLHLLISIVGLALSGDLAITATVMAAAVTSLPGSFSSVDTTQMTGWDPPILRQLAADYASAVKGGEISADLRVTAFRQATLLSIWAAITAAVAFCLIA